MQVNGVSSLFQLFLKHMLLKHLGTLKSKETHRFKNEVFLTCTSKLSAAFTL